MPFHIHIAHCSQKSTMIGLKVICVALLVELVTAGVVTQQSQGQCDAVLNQEECNNESAVKISRLFALRRDLLREHESVRLIREGICEAKEVLRNLETQLNNTLEEMEKQEMDIRNLSAAENELQGSQYCDENIPRDCCQIKKMFPSAKSGLYAIRYPCVGGNALFSSSKLTVYCDMETDGGGWIVIQRRDACMGWVSFAKNFSEYEKGFGDLNGEFWLGLKNIYELTNQDSVELKTQVWNYTNSTINWNYPYFRIYNANQAYQMLHNIPRGSGNGTFNAFGNEGNYRYNFRFITYDSPSGLQCSYIKPNGWWCSSRNGYQCDYANLNGLHKPSGIPGTDPVRERLVWRTASGYEIFTNSEMKIRRQSCGLS